MEKNGDIVLKNKRTKVFTDSIGRFGSAASFTFNTRQKGLIFEQGVSESGGFYVDGDYAVIWSPGDKNRLLRIYDEDGMIERWYLDRTGNAFTVSDERKKENIEEMSNMTEKLMKVKPVIYTYKQDKEEQEKGDESRKYCGFLAQNLESMFPSLVDTDENGNKFVNYNGMLPILLSALKEQQEIINKQKKRLKNQSKRLKAIEDKLGLR